MTELSAHTDGFAHDAQPRFSVIALDRCSCPSLSSAGAPLARRASRRPASTTTPTRPATLRTQRFPQFQAPVQGAHAGQLISLGLPHRLGTVATQPERGVEHRVRRQRGMHGRDLRVPDQLLRLRPIVRPYVPNDPSAPEPCSPSNQTATCGMATAVVCIGNVASGYFFDATEVVLAGANATTTTCAFGLAGYATRLCVWNGPNSQYGVWAAPASYCQRTPRARHTYTSPHTYMPVIAPLPAIQLSPATPRRTLTPPSARSCTARRRVRA